MEREPIRILLVEDNPGDARLIEEYLAEADGSQFRCCSVERLDEAFAQLGAAEFDVVLLDLSLPDSRGFETFQQVYARAPGLPIVVLTGLDDEDLGTRTVHAGAQDYLVKGQVDGPLLVRSLRYAIERKKVEKQLAHYAEQLRKKNEQMEAELKMAREIQQAFLIQQYPTFPPGAPAGKSALRFSHRYQPTAALAGDFFDVLAVSDTEAGVFICDVMGHGVRAALVTAFLRGLVEELLPVAADPGRLLTEINHRLAAVLRRTDTVMFASAFYLVADVSSGRMRYANAGHPDPLVVHRDSGGVEPLHAEGCETEPALGLLEEFVHRTCQASFRDRDLVILFTDGVYEVMGPNGQQFGEERLMDGVRKRRDLSPEQLFDELLAEVRAFSATDEFTDDVCLVGMEVAATRREATASARRL